MDARFIVPQLDRLKGSHEVKTLLRNSEGLVVEAIIVGTNREVVLECHDNGSVTFYVRRADGSLNLECVRGGDESVSDFLYKNHTRWLAMVRYAFHLLQYNYRGC